MNIHIQNIVLYDRISNVIGHVELRIEDNQTHVKLQHNLGGKGLIFSLSHQSETHVFEQDTLQNNLVIDKMFDLKSEIFAFIVRKETDKLTPIASGAINITASNPSSKPKEVILPTNPPSQVPSPDHVPEPIHDAPQGENPPAKTSQAVDVLNRAKEIDQVLRTVCSFEEDGLNACKQCPYYDHFFKSKASGQG